MLYSISIIVAFISAAQSMKPPLTLNSTIGEKLENDYIGAFTNHLKHDLLKEGVTLAYKRIKFTIDQHILNKDPKSKKAALDNLDKESSICQVKLRETCQKILDRLCDTPDSSFVAEFGKLIAKCHKYHTADDVREVIRKNPSVPMVQAALSLAGLHVVTATEYFTPRQEVDDFTPEQVVAVLSPLKEELKPFELLMTEVKATAARTKQIATEAFQPMKLALEKAITDNYRECKKQKETFEAELVKVKKQLHDVVSEVQVGKESKKVAKESPYMHWSVIAFLIVLAILLCAVPVYIARKLMAKPNDSEPNEAEQLV